MRLDARGRLERYPHVLGTSSFWTSTRVWRARRNGQVPSAMQHTGVRMCMVGYWSGTVVDILCVPTTTMAGAVYTKSHGSITRLLKEAESLA